MGLQNPPRGGGSGSGLLFGTGTSIFADNAARDAYFTANPMQLTQYDDNAFLLIQVGTGFQRRQSNAWIVVTNVVAGPKGDKGDTGDPPDPKGQLIATATIPAGEHYERDDVLDWVLATGIPTGFSTRGAGEFRDSELLVPTKRVATTQRGWLAELVINGTVGSDATFDFGVLTSEAVYLDAGSGQPRLNVYYYTREESEASFGATYARDGTIAATDTIELKLYILQ